MQLLKKSDSRMVGLLEHSRRRKETLATREWIPGSAHIDAWYRSELRSYSRGPYSSLLCSGASGHDDRVPDLTRFHLTIACRTTIAIYGAPQSPRDLDN